jgi:hypothetical protein
MTPTPPSPSTSPLVDPPQTPASHQPETEGPIRVSPLRFKSGSQPSPSPEVPAAAGPGDPVAPTVSSDKQPGPKSPKSGSSPGSSLVDQKLISEGIEGTVIAITGQLHELLARDAYDEWALVYLADEQDAKGIAKPATKIISRRTGDVTGGNPDIADAIAIGIAATFYLVKQLGRLLSAKRARRAGANIQATPGPPTDAPAYADPP